jgi:hypothetical protein
MNSLQRILVAVFRKHDVHVSLSRKYRHHPQTEQDELQVPQGHHLCIGYNCLGTDRTENTVPLLLFNCCLAGCAESIPLLFAGRCLATAAVQSPIARSPPSSGSTCHSMNIEEVHLRI